MKSEIGSNFCITPDELAKENVACFSLDDLKCNGSDYALFSTGRSATSFVIKAIIERQPDLNKTVCLPPFTCQTVIEPFVKAGFEVVTYPLDSNFDAKVNDILQVLVSSNAKILLIHKYFGFNTIHNFNDLVYILKQKGIIIIEDCTQSLFSQFDRVDADYFVGSLRKWCGAPDGGFAVCKTGVFYNKPIDEDYTLIEAKKRAGVSKYRYLYHHQGEKQSFLSDYAQAEIILNAQKKLYTIGSLSKNIYSQLDVPLMIKRRQRNYKYLFDAIKDIKDIKPAFNNISSQICPLYFPVVCQDRTSIRNLLRNNDIYAPIIWPKAEALPEICNEVQYLYDNLLCIPIDQRYCIDDMERIASVLRGDEIRSAWMSWEDLYPFKEQLIDMEHELMIKYHYPD